VLWFEYEMSPKDSCFKCLVPVDGAILEGIETLGGGAKLEEVCHWGPLKVVLGPASSPHVLLPIHQKVKNILSHMLLPP
jgi:hypothetical protein